MTKYTYVESATAPIKQVTIRNSKGYHNLVLNKNKNGKAIRISDEFGGQRVHITLDKVDELIADLKALQARGVATSVESLSYAA